LKRTIGSIDFQKEKIEGTIQILLERLKLPYNVRLGKRNEIEDIENYYSLPISKNSQTNEINHTSKTKFKEKTISSYEMPKALSPFDDRVDILKSIIKNLMIKYYREGRQGEFDNTKSKRILCLISVITKFDNTFFMQYTRDGGKPNYNRLSRLFFDCSHEIFEQRLLSGEIQKEEINRDFFIIAGDLAFEILIQYQKNRENSIFLFKDAHWALYYSIEKNKFFLFKIWKRII